MHDTSVPGHVLLHTHPQLGQGPRKTVGWIGALGVRKQCADALDLRLLVGALMLAAHCHNVDVAAGVGCSARPCVLAAAAPCSAAASPTPAAAADPAAALARATAARPIRLLWVGTVQHTVQAAVGKSHHGLPLCHDHDRACQLQQAHPSLPSWAQPQHYFPGVSETLGCPRSCHHTVCGCACSFDACFHDCQRLLACCSCCCRHCITYCSSSCTRSAATQTCTPETAAQLHVNSRQGRYQHVYMRCTFSDLRSHC